MWISLKNGQYFLRHVCQDSDELNTYRWTAHNGRDYGRQVLVDPGLLLTTSFLKENERAVVMVGTGQFDWMLTMRAREVSAVHSLPAN